jgi:prepilin-type N-terminal cleavage/methylation domain-containing protein
MKPRPRAFTLIELLVVIAIIALLIGIVLPALSKARNASRITISLNNTRQMMLGVATYRSEKKDQVPMRMCGYLNGRLGNNGGGAWDTWHYGGKNCDVFWQTYVAAGFDEHAYTRPLNDYLYSGLSLEKPAGYVNTGVGTSTSTVGDPRFWTLNRGTLLPAQRDAVQMPAYRSPGDKATKQRAWPQETPGITSYDDVGTSYHINMKWWDQVTNPPLPGDQVHRFDAGVRRIRLASEFDPTNKFVWIHDQTADVVANQGSGPIPLRPQFMGEFGEKNKSVMGYLDARAEYNKMVSGSFYDPMKETPPYGVGKYIFIFNLPGTPLPAP